MGGNARFTAAWRSTYRAQFLAEDIDGSTMTDLIKNNTFDDLRVDGALIWTADTHPSKVRRAWEIHKADWLASAEL